MAPPLVDLDHTATGFQVTAASIAASYHIVVGLGFAYSAILIPNLNVNGSNSTGQIFATKTESSWIGITCPRV